MGDVLDGVGHPSVLGNGFVCVVGHAGVAHDNIFQNSPRLDRVPNVRFFLLREVNDFGVATAFKVEDGAVGRPAVLVVSNEQAVGICR